MQDLGIHDHRVIGQRQDLFHFSPHAAGMVFWHPRGWALYRALEEAVRARLAAEGYLEVRSPQLVRSPVWERSGHWQHFREGLFVVRDESGVDAALKPVSCPGHLELAAHRSLSYRDLPLRYSEMGLVHRAEPSGSLHGLFRLRQFSQDDGHVLLPEERVPEEVAGFVGSLLAFYQEVGFEDVRVAFSSRPEERAGSDEQWDRAEARLREAADLAGLSPIEQPGEGAFYGPKLEFILSDRHGRSWQCGSIQLDLVLPERFGVHYADAEGKRRHPAMLHRAMLGSLERFLGILLEHHEGRLPAWLAPEQAVIIPVSGAASGYAAEVAAAAREAGLRVRVDDRAESLGRRVRDALQLAVPFVIAVGERERERREVSLRRRGGSAAVPLDAALSQLAVECARPAVRGAARQS